MAIFSEPKQKRITTTINQDDFLFMKQHGLKFAHAIRAFCRDYRVNINAADAEPSIRELKQSRDKILENRDKILAALRKKLGDAAFADFITKI